MYFLLNRWAPSHPRYLILSSYAFLVARDNRGNGVEEKKDEEGMVSLRDTRLKYFG